MSSFLYPTLPGLSFDVTRQPTWNSFKQVAHSAKRSVKAQRQYPLMHFELTYEVLRDAIAASEVKSLVGLFNAVQAGFDDFLFTDPDFNTFGIGNPQKFGTGDGVTSTFQLVAFYANSGAAGYAERIQNLNGAPTIYINGTPTSAYTLGPSGQVIFTLPPAIGASLTWTGSFYYRVAFDDDELDLSKFMNLLWTIKTIKFTQVAL